MKIKVIAINILLKLSGFEQRLNWGLSPNLYFYRDSNGLEVNVLFKQGPTLTSIEIKSSATFNKAFVKGLKNFQALTKLSTKGYIIYSGEFSVDT